MSGWWEEYIVVPVKFEDRQKKQKSVPVDKIHQFNTMEQMMHQTAIIILSNYSIKFIYLVHHQIGSNL